ncbi:Gfo/Idh/MocA family protein [Salinimonas iocasae]|uniref:Gfo/Idh/MocA family oxidoreductase n=1 Tax=Salinimonas iocasae TaxID=2572577 RepID=A0A5B7YCA7_9ALTE|nr:Gfo/Idh/MocA family oxidoreductase [Salinimonas iocasae]QCZ92219.1 Gfo/Idh/MocA family oxidoreductase [Salinimonas iocasae]
MTILDRRQFIKLTASGLLVAAAPAWSLPTPQKKLGVALLGLGNYSTNLLAPALQDTQYCELRGIITGSPEKIPRWQKKYGIKDAIVYSYDSMNNIANNDDIDIIYVVTPTGTHKRFSVQAANTGKHVWCEKPMAMDEQECQEIIDACDKNGVKLAIGYRMQHEPNTRTFGDYRDSLPYGPITGLSSYAGYAGNGRPADNWRMQKEMGGGALYDMGVYAINGARFMTGKEPLSVTGRHEKSHPDIFREVDETTFFTMDFGEGVTADCGTSVVKGFNHLKTQCENGWYELKPMQRYSGVTGKTSDGKRLAPIDKMQQTLQMDNDAQAILGTGPALVTGAEGLADIKLVNAIFKAADTGKSVPVG